MLSIMPEPSTGKALLPILVKIAKTYPQALYFPFMVSKPSIQVLFSKVDKSPLLLFSYFFFVFLFFFCFLIFFFVFLFFFLFYFFFFVFLFFFLFSYFFFVFFFFFCFLIFFLFSVLVIRMCVCWASYFVFVMKKRRKKENVLAMICYYRWLFLCE